MTDNWLDKITSFAESLTKATNTLGTIGIPADLHLKDPAYQLAWLDQQIPLQEKYVAELEAKAQTSPSVALAKTSLPSLRDMIFDDKITQTELAKRLHGNVQQLGLVSARQALIELKARRAVLAPPSSAPVVPKLSRADQCRQNRARIHAEYAQLEQNEQDDLKLAKTPLDEQRMKNIYADAKREKLDELKKWMV